MPLEQKNLKTPETKNDPIVQKQEVFKKIAETFPEYRELIKHTEANPIAFVFQHSITDGLELAKKLGLTPEEIRKATIENPLFGLSHEKLIFQMEMSIRRIFEYSDVNVQLNNTAKQVRSLVSVHTPKTIIQKENARTFFEAHHEKRRKEITEFPKEIIDSIANYYAEFLPYQADNIGGLVEEYNQEKERGIKNKSESISDRIIRYTDKGEKILLQKYIDILVKEAAGRHDVSPVQMLTDLGVPQSEMAHMSRLVIMETTLKEQQDPLPTLLINDGNGNKMNFNMEAARKPVEKIKEKIIIQEITKSVENLLNNKYKNQDAAYKVIFDEILGKHIISLEPTGLSKEKQQELIFNEQESVQQIENLFKKYNFNFDHTNFEDALDEFKDNNEAFREELQSIDAGNSKILKLLDLSDTMKTLEHVENGELKKVFEYHVLSSRIHDSVLNGVTEYLANIVEGKQTSSLSEEQIGQLFLELEDRIKSTLKNTPELKNPLHQLDIFKVPTFENFSSYFMPKENSEILEDVGNKYIKMRNFIEQSKRFFNLIKTAMKDKAKWLLESFSLPAKPHQNIHRLTDRLTAACYPEEWQKYQDKHKEWVESNKGFSFEMQDPHGMTHNQFESMMAGGNVGKKKNQMESNESMKGFEATFDKPLNAMLVTNIVSYDTSSGNWKRTHVPVDGDMNQNRKHEKVSAKLTTPIDGTVSVIPSPFGAKEISTNKSSIEKDSLGIHTAVGNEPLSTWSYEIPVGKLSIENVSEQTYTRFLDRLIDEGGLKYIEKIPGLPVECQMFLDTIKNMSPRDRVAHIQKFITSHSFYDSYDNEMRNEMNNTSIAERVSLMQERLSQLRDELGEEIPDTMLFAGVCADFAIIGEMMLKESGIASGIAEGYRISGTTINSDNAHAKNIVMWPDETGKTIMAEVEMTPSAFTGSQRAAFAQQGLEPEPLQKVITEAEVRKKEHEEELKNTSDEILHQIEEILAQNPDATVGVNRIELRNHIVNYISSVCSLEDLYVYKRMLESYRFTPIKSADAHDLSEKVKNIGFMQSEYKRWKSDYNGRDDGLERISNSGKNLMGEIDRLYIKSAIAGTEDQFISTFKNIPEYLNTELSDKHKTLWNLFKVYIEHK